MAPATVGTLAALVVYWVLDLLVFNGNGNSIWFFFLILGTAILGVWATGYIDNADDQIQVVASLMSGLVCGSPCCFYL